MAGFGHGTIHEDALFFTLAEDLKTPLLRIAYKAELIATEHNGNEDIRTTAIDAIKLIDAYLLGAKSQAQFELEPVSPSAVLFDVAHELSDYAQTNDCELIIRADARHGSALLHRKALMAALSAIGMVFIEAQSILGGKDKSVEMAAYHTARGLAVGVFQPHGSRIIDTQLLSRAHSHAGKASRPFAGLASGASARLFVAEQLMGGMQSQLRTARRGGLAGLAADLLPSSQLKLV